MDEVIIMIIILVCNWQYLFIFFVVMECKKQNFIQTTNSFWGSNSIQLMLMSFSDSSTYSLIHSWLMSGRASGHTKLASNTHGSTTPWWWLGQYRSSSAAARLLGFGQRKRALDTSTAPMCLILVTPLSQGMTSALFDCLIFHVTRKT